MFPRFLRPLIVSLVCIASAFAEEVPSSAAVPVPQPGMEKRHAEKVAAIKGHAFDLMLIRDSITHGFDNPEVQGGVGAVFRAAQMPSVWATAAGGRRTSCGIWRNSPTGRACSFSM